jgi:AraC-like DNA-binding protein
MMSRSVAIAEASSTTVLASVTNGIEQFISKHGVEPERVFRAAGLSCGLSLRPNSPINLRNFCSLMDEAIKQTGNDNFGLLFGSESGPEILGMLGYMAVSSTNLEHAIHAMEEFFPVHQSNTTFHLNKERGVCVLEYHLLDGLIIDRKQDAELSLAILCNVMRQTAGPTWNPLEVHFEHSRPFNSIDHDRIFGSDLRFGQECNAIVFDAKDLSRPMLRPDPLLLALMRQSMDSVAPKQPLSPSISDLVSAEIIKILPAGEPKLEDIAELARLPSWTLQRRLMKEGTRFSELVDNVRKQLAKSLIVQQHIPISEMAFQLGYSEVSAFSRAFVRWFGESPRQSRRAAASVLPE